MGPEPDEAAPSSVIVAAVVLVVVVVLADTDDTMFGFCIFCRLFSCAPLRQRILVFSAM